MGGPYGYLENFPKSYPSFSTTLIFRPYFIYGWKIIHPIFSFFIANRTISKAARLNFSFSQIVPNLSQNSSKIVAFVKKLFFLSKLGVFWKKNTKNWFLILRLILKNFLTFFRWSYISFNVFFKLEGGKYPGVCRGSSITFNRFHFRNFRCYIIRGNLLCFSLSGCPRKDKMSPERKYQFVFSFYQIAKDWIFFHQSFLVSDNCWN